MRLDPTEIDLMRASWREAALRRPEFAALFYDRLFEIAPETRALFPAEMAAQRVKLASTLGVIVAKLHDCEALRPMLSDLARRHVGYGVRASHYEAVGDALVWALARALGETASPEVEAAWRRSYQELSATMIAASGEGAAG